MEEDEEQLEEQEEDKGWKRSYYLREAGGEGASHHSSVVRPPSLFIEYLRGLQFFCLSLLSTQPLPSWVFPFGFSPFASDLPGVWGGAANRQTASPTDCIPPRVSSAGEHCSVSSSFSGPFAPTLLAHSKLCSSDRKIKEGKHGKSRRLKALDSCSTSCSSSLHYVLPGLATNKGRERYGPTWWRNSLDQPKELTRRRGD